MPTDRVERRYADCVLTLRKRYLRRLELRRAEIFALEAEQGGAGADLDKLKEVGIESSAQLREAFMQSRRKTKSQGV